MAGRRNDGQGWRIGIDAGGTFTDFVALGPSGVIAFKVPSTPDDPSRAIHQAVEEFLQRVPDARGRRLVIVHGSTVATNALLEGKTARVVFVTNAGFEDLVEIGRQARRDLYSLQPSRAAPLLSRARRLGVPERTLASGRRELRPSADDLVTLDRKLRRQRPEAVAIGLLHSFANPAAEKELERTLRPLGIPVCRSSEVAPRFREYERFSTTVANAALLPVVQGYLQRLRKKLSSHDLLIQQSNGGLTSVADASNAPVRLVLSGPAGGVHGAERRLRDSGIEQAVAFDMGGTSTDVCMIRGEAGRTDQVELADRPLLVETMDVHSIGAGGGSVLWLDQAGSLRVGPRSAGADPGPACYGRGDVPCLTDAHVVLGRLPREDRLGGQIILQPARSEAALKPLARTLGVRVRDVAAAALAIADATMEQAIKAISLERGHDPREAALFSFGGAGGLHACRLARGLNMREAVVPPVPGASSAFGMAVSDARLDLTQGIVEALNSDTMPRLRERVRRMEERIRSRMRKELGPGPVQIERRIACRYRGQSFELTVPFNQRCRANFESQHDQRYGFQMPECPLESVALTVTAIRRTRVRPVAQQVTDETARIGTASVHFPDAGRAAATDRARRVPVLDRERLSPGTRMRGPAILLEPTATTVVEPGFEFAVDDSGSLRMRARGTR